MVYTNADAHAQKTTTSPTQTTTTTTWPCRTNAIAATINQHCMATDGHYAEDAEICAKEYPIHGTTSSTSEIQERFQPNLQMNKTMFRWRGGSDEIGKDGAIETKYSLRCYYSVAKKTKTWDTFSVLVVG